ncbi:uncharacterized protein TNCV_5024551 [Trichonephila clavipes]|nr:uncharacterized protein TNCV_5024551 [Trichonephila clavipes]
MDVYVAGLLMSLKRIAPEEMNVYLDPEQNKLKYPCKMCNRKSCAVTKAYLLWRRLTKREPYSLFNNQPTLPEKPIECIKGKPVFLQLPSEKRILFENYWMPFNCTPENEESVKDSIDSAKEEPECFGNICT